MKIIIFLVLAGLSLAQDMKCQTGPKGKGECLMYALKELRSTKVLKELVCGYRAVIDENDEDDQEAIRNVIGVLACSGCSADEFLGTEGETFENLLNDTGNLSDYGAKLAQQITDALGMSVGEIKLLCNLDGDVLASECKDKILTKDPPGLINDLNKMFCEKELNESTAGDLIELLKNVGCLGDDPLHTRDTVEKILEDLGEEGFKDALIKVLDTIKNLLTGNDLLNHLLCDLIKFLLGENPVPSVRDVLGGGGGGGEDPLGLDIN